MKQLIKQVKRLTKEEKIKAQKRFEKKFQNASKAEQRIMIAKDVIAQIKLEKFKAKKGTYFKLKGKPINENKPEVEVRDLINDSEQTCTVCALGGLFASCVSITDNLKVGSLEKEYNTIRNEINYDDLKKKLRKHFSLEQLTLIESAFEQSQMNSTGHWILPYSNLYNKREKAIDFVTSKTSAENTMIKIMENIIRNKGTFKP